MALELQLPSPPLDFDFNTGRVSPSIDTRPTTPKRFGEVYFSAPASPARNSDNSYGFYDDLSFSNDEKRLWWFPSPNRANDNAFASSSEALNGRKINKMKDPLYEGSIKSPLLSPQTPNSKISQHKKSFWSTFSPKRKKEIKFSPFRATEKEETRTEQLRGRERISRSGRRITRSLSPLRVSKYPWEEQQEQEKGTHNSNQPSSSIKPPLPLSSKGSRKWRLRDFLLFRSASEGRASEKDPFRKYAEMYRKHQAYKQGILGRLAVNPASHALAYGFGSPKVKATLLTHKTLIIPSNYVIDPWPALDRMPVGQHTPGFPFDVRWICKLLIKSVRNVAFERNAHQ